ncbi:unnamed protein product [Cochlearia groenlandica]
MHLRSLVMSEYMAGQVKLSTAEEIKVAYMYSHSQPAENAHAKRNQTRNQDSSDKREQEELPGPPKVARKKIGMIMGGLVDCNHSIRSIKRAQRGVVAAVKWANVADTSEHTAKEITFTKHNIASVAFPHNDPLVVELLIADCEVAVGTSIRMR